MHKDFEISEIQPLAAGFVFVLVFVVVSKIFINTSSPEGTHTCVGSQIAWVAGVGGAVGFQRCACDQGMPSL